MLSHHRDRIVAACKACGLPLRPLSLSEQMLTRKNAVGRDCSSIEGPAGLVNFEKRLQSKLDELNISLRLPCKVRNCTIYSLFSQLTYCRQLRIRFTKEGVLDVETFLVPSVPLLGLFPEDFDEIVDVLDPSYGPVHIAPLLTLPSLFTVHKTTHRPRYDWLRQMLPAQEDSAIPEV